MYQMSFIPSKTIDNHTHHILCYNAAKVMDNVEPNKNNVKQNKKQCGAKQKHSVEQKPGVEKKPN